MKTIFKTMVLAAVMMAGIQANAAITCSVTTNGTNETEYSDLQGTGVFNLSEGESAIIVDKVGYPLVLKGLSFAVHKEANTLSASAFYNGTRKAEAIALSENGKQILLVLPSKGLAFACQDSAK